MPLPAVEAFFKLLLGPHTRGYICLATIEAENTVSFKEKFFSWPDGLEDILEFVESVTPTYNVYFCPQLLTRPKRIKENIKHCFCAWADLDECDPSNLLVQPSVVVESSPLRHQAYWVFEDLIDAEVAEDVSKRIAYFHSFQGADRSGWDLTQLLRVPGTYNFKPGLGQAPVKNIDLNRSKYRVDDFKQYPKVSKNLDLAEYPFPDHLKDVTGKDILDKYEDILPPIVRFHFENQPDREAREGWSGALWSLQMACFEADLTREETFVVARDSACNKFKRDNKPEAFLWQDVCKAWIRHEEHQKLLAPDTTRQARLLSAEEANQVSGVRTFVEEYSKWARSLGDAAPQYHMAGALTILSTLLSGQVRLPTSFGTIKPNLWFMILADTTLTRKTTAMDIAMDLIEEVDASTILATDGSIEGLMTGLSTRPGQPSIFLRDEFSGLLEAMSKKDYMAGMSETLTKLYDGKLQKRILKKEIIEVKDPCLVIFAGGIKNKVCGLMTTEHVSSGFIPRFVFVTAESDLSKIKPIGPPTQTDNSGRDKILGIMRDLRMHYATTQDLVVENGQMVLKTPLPFTANLTSDAWNRYNVLEADMMKAGLHSKAPDIMTPTYDRLCKSALKTAVLIAAARKRPENKEVLVELIDILTAIKYAEEWREYTNEVINNVGIGANEREMAAILRAIVREPGVARSKLMQRHHLTARNADHIFNTLEQRGQIQRSQSGPQRWFPFGSSKKSIVLNGRELK